MKTRLTFIVLFLVVVALWLSGCGTTVAPGKGGLRWRPATLGLSEKPVREGFYWHLPWNDVITYSLQWQTFSEKVESLTRDDLHIVVEASVLVRPMGEELYWLQLEIGPEFYPRVVKSEFLTVVRGVMSDYAMVEIPKKSLEIEARILERLKERIKGKHLELDDVTINHIDFSSGIIRAIETKLAKEQEKIQKGFELDIARQETEIVREKAKGEADALTIRAKGEADAIKLRAVGQAEAQRIIDQTLTSRFLQFKAFESPNAKIIFVPTDKEGLPLVISPEGK